MTPAGEPFAEAIDGVDGVSWRLPLAPLTATSTPEAYSPGEQPQLDKLQAAARLVRGTQGTACKQHSLTGHCSCFEGRALLQTLNRPCAWC